MSIRLRDFYDKGLKHFDFSQTASSILKRAMAGDDRAEDFEEAIRSDAYLTRRIVTRASEALKTGRVSTLAHAVVLLGKDNVRDFVLAQSLRRQFEPNPDADQKTTFENAKEKVRRAREAEQFARALGADIVGPAYAAGYIYDVFETWMKSDPAFGEKERVLFEATWKHGCRTAAIAWDLAHHSAFNISLKKLSFGAGLLHETGRLLLACSYPDRTGALAETIARVRAQNPADDAFEAPLERAEFRLSHAEAGSLLLWRAGALKEFEAITDHHHDAVVLQGRDPQLHKLVTILKIADRTACALDAVPSPELAVYDEIRASSDAPKAFQASDLSGIVSSLRSRELVR